MHNYILWIKSGIWTRICHAKQGPSLQVFRLEQIFGLQYFLSHLSHIYNAYPAIHAQKIGSHLMWGGGHILRGKFI